MSDRGLLRVALGVLVLVASGACSSRGVEPLQIAPGMTTIDVGLQPGDAVRVQVFQEEELTGEFPVDQNGTIVLPLLGERQVRGVSSDSLERLLIADFGEYLETPSVDVTVLRRISILGEVRNPGLYPVDLTMSLTDALALAGGLSPSGNRNAIRLRRGQRELVGSLNERLLLSETPVRSGDEIFVTERSWASRNVGLLTALMGAVTSVTIALLIR